MTWPGTGISSRPDEDHQHAPITNIRHRQIRRRPAVGPWRSGIQITRFGVASSGHLSNQVTEQISGSVRVAPDEG
jgi:hypothetical protein